MYVCKWTEELQGMIDYLALAWQNNFFPRILITRGMTFKFEYLAEFEFIFKNNLGAWSGAQELAFDEKKWMSKISCKCTVPLIHFSSLSVSSDMYSMYNISTNYLYSRTCLQNVSFLMVSVSCISSYLYVRICSLTLIKMGFLKNDLENFNCLFLKKVWSDDFFKNSLCQLQAF